MTENVTSAIRQMVRFGVKHGLLGAEDALYTRNLLMDMMRMNAPDHSADDGGSLPVTITPILEALLDAAVQFGIIADTADERDRFSARLAGAITPAPVAVREAFSALYKEKGASAATAWFYEMCRACDYIRVDHIAKNVRFFADTKCGELEITINLSKPEKDPRDIAAQAKMAQVDYPKCMLCIENPGYAGRPGYPARQNHRMIPLRLDGDKWYFQYSPYLYYDEHCIVLNAEHVPMRLTEKSFRRLFDFVEQFPHYFIGSNADLPIVGGSILNHDHFQGGHYAFPMDAAQAEFSLVSPRRDVDACVVNWPMTCIRLISENASSLIAAAMEMLDGWRAYSDPDCDIFAETTAKHNTITPILRKDGRNWILNLVLRNNRTSDAHPMGIFHPHAPLHHIKKENIGLIEVMGLFILPGRLKSEIAGLTGYLTGETAIDAMPDESSPLFKHYDWIRSVVESCGTQLSPKQADIALERALADVCAEVLSDAGVYKQNENGRQGLLRFLAAIGYAKQG